MKRHLITIFVVVMIVAATVLGVAAVRLARKAADSYKNDMRDLLQEQCGSLSESGLAFCRDVENDLYDLLIKADTDSSGILNLQKKSPFIKDVFILNHNYTPVYPAVSSRFFQQYQALFLTKVSSSTSTGEETTTGKIQLLEQFSQSVQLEQQLFIPEQSQFTTRFQQLAVSKQSGWIPWVNQNEYLPLFWVRQPATGLIVGVQLETIALHSRLVPLVSLPENSPFHIEIVDSYSGELAGSGFLLPQNLQPSVTMAMSPEFLPNLQIRGYINNHAGYGEQSLVLVNLLIVIATLIILVVGAIVLFYLLRRELILAGQKTSFVANVSHELKTPLTSIRMYSEMMEQNLEKLPAEKQKRYLNIIITESERLTRLIANVLNFNKIEAGEKKYNREKVSLNEFLDELRGSCAKIVNAADIDFAVTIPDEVIYVNIDRDSLIQVMQNLITNVVKYAAEGKFLAVTLAKLDSRVEIAVTDKGPGIAAGHARKIFRKFYRINNNLTAKTSGSGLGLTISRKLMLDQDGDLLYRENPGGGSVFTVVMKAEDNE